MPKGLFTAGFLARLAYEKHVLGRPVHRIVKALAADGFDVAPGTLCGALKQVAPLIAPWAEAIAAHGRTAGHVHADETSWQVFEDIEDKDGHRWWLWVFVTDATTVFVMDTSRSAGVAAGQLGIDREQTALEAGRRLVISSDFHKAYQSLACIDGVDPLWCWAHIRRYFLRAGAAHPEALGDWCDAWTERIAVLYRAHHALAATMPGTDAAPMRARAAGSGPSPTSTRTASCRPATPQRACCTRPPPRSSPRSATSGTGWPATRTCRSCRWTTTTAERALRTPVIGRKNFYGSGAEWAAHLAADVWTVTATAARHDIEPLGLLTGYLQACARTRRHRPGRSRPGPVPALDTPRTRPPSSRQRPAPGSRPVTPRSPQSRPIPLRHMTPRVIPPCPAGATT